MARISTTCNAELNAEALTVQDEDRKSHGGDG